MAYYRKRGKSWYFTVVDADGIPRERKGCTDRRATEGMAAAVEAEAARVRAGLSDAREEARRRHEAAPLVGHLDAWHADLTARGGTAKHADLYKLRAGTVADLCGAKRLADLTPAAVQGALAALRSQGRSLGTCNHHRGAIRSFTRWAWKEGRLAADPLVGVAGFNAREDRRHDRRTLALDDVRRLIRAAHDGPTYRKMSGPARALCYRLAVATGLRYSELASLTQRSFDLDGERPSVTVAAAYSKNGQAATLPLPQDLARDLAESIAATAADAPVFPLPADAGAKMLRPDLEQAGIPYRDAAGLVFDFHALRCQCATLADAAGVSPRIVQRMMRHSTLDLTSRYTRPRFHDLAGAADALPSLAPADATREAETAAATGTEGQRIQNLVADYLPNGGGGNGRKPADSVAKGQRQGPPDFVAETPDSQGFGATRRADARPVGSSGVRDRTGDLRVMNPPTVLYKPISAKSLRIKGGAVADHLPNGHREISHELAEVVALWEALPDAIRAGILAMVRAGAPADRR